jgi:hypothetical protein
MTLAPDRFILFEIAYNLRMPVFELELNMPNEELLEWIAYFERRPVDWRDDLRFYRILQSLGVKAKPEEIFESIASIKKMEAYDAEREAFMKTSKELTTSLKRSSFFTKLLGAQGGDTPEFLKEM